MPLTSYGDREFLVNKPSRKLYVLELLTTLYRHHLDHSSFLSCAAPGCLEAKPTPHILLFSLTVRPRPQGTRNDYGYL